MCEAALQEVCLSERKRGEEEKREQTEHKKGNDEGRKEKLKE